MSWSDFLEQEQKELEKINEFLDSEKEQFGEELLILPPAEMIFSHLIFVHLKK